MSRPSVSSIFVLMISATFHLADGGVPKVPGLGLLGERYHYWCGASGRRYLFTAVSTAELGDFSDAVVVLARHGSRGLTGEDVVLIGGDHRMLMERIGAGTGLVAFIHLLSPTHAARQAAVEDLLGSRQSMAA